MQKLLFKDWSDVWHIAVCSLLSFFILFAFIRITGKRTLASLTAFDFVVIIALGTILSSMMLAMVSIASGATALVMVILMQYTLAFAAKKSKFLEGVVNSTPTLLYYDGKFLTKNMSKEVISEGEIFSEIRRFGLYDLSEVKAVVMERNGQVTVIAKSQALHPQKTSLDDVKMPDNPDK